VRCCPGPRPRDTIGACRILVVRIAAAQCNDLSSPLRDFGVALPTATGRRTREGFTEHHNGPSGLERSLIPVKGMAAPISARILSSNQSGTDTTLLSPYQSSVPAVQFMW